MSSSGSSSSAVGARLRAMVDGLGERSAVLGAMEGRLILKSVGMGVFLETCFGTCSQAHVAGGPVTRSQSFDTISLKKVRSGTVEQLKCPRTRVLVHIVSWN